MSLICPRSLDRAATRADSLFPSRFERLFVVGVRLEYNDDATTVALIRAKRRLEAP